MMIRLNPKGKKSEKEKTTHWPNDWIQFGSQSGSAMLLKQWLELQIKLNYIWLQIILIHLLFNNILHMMNT